jgi:hypothetical protein
MRWERYPETLNWGKPFFSMGLENFIEIDLKTGIQFCASAVCCLWGTDSAYYTTGAPIRRGTSVYRTPVKVTFSTQMRSLTPILWFSISPHPLQQVLVELGMTFLSAWVCTVINFYSDLMYTSLILFLMDSLWFHCTVPYIQPTTWHVCHAKGILFATVCC